MLTRAVVVNSRPRCRSWCMNAGDGEARVVEGQVQQLLTDAQDPDKLCALFVGWSAWCAGLLPPRCPAWPASSAEGSLHHDRFLFASRPASAVLLHGARVTDMVEGCSCGLLCRGGVMLHLLMLSVKRCDNRGIGSCCRM